MKKILLVFLCLLLASCTLPVKPEDKFKTGDYVGGVKVLANNFNAKAKKLEQKNKPWKDKDILYLQVTVGGLVEMAQKNIQQAAVSDYELRIKSYQLLLTIKTELEDKSYSPYLEKYLSLYTVDGLKESLAIQFYQQANAIVAANSADYLRKAKLYRQGYEYFNYKDIKKRAEDNQNMYYKTAAQEYYTEAQANVRDKNYKQAADNFRKAHDVYLPLGNYKDSAKLAAIYEKKWRTAEAEGHYQQAQGIVRKARLLSEYRQAAALFREASNVYSPYGNTYKDSARQADVYERKGQVQILIRGNDYLASQIRSVLQKSYVSFVNSPASANLVIDVSMGRGHFQQYKDNIQTNDKYENLKVGTKKVADENGNMIEQSVYEDFYFKQYSVKTINEAVTNAEVHTSGLYELNRSYSGKSTSSQTYYWFDGHVPRKYTAYTKGTLLSRDEQLDEARTNLWSHMRGDIAEMSRALANL
ncbi:hypothetical protein BHC47_10655 [Snodgrassella alvi]|uniref:Lipoprotein n=1 Tax=Snodgrassella alvi TaxID=1196083 RepID=A0A2N9Y4X8_9NEIS|nr:hypothetical protein [Snodgrassella alvi]PIT63069.1 hypothetical protein BHC56_00425 [Snodgrassella alvi]PIT63312.1 hypothetical protein BHC47_10655 [Snodgrassella alvi]